MSSNAKTLKNKEKPHSKKQDTSYYWVNIGTSYNQVKNDCYLWAPRYTLKANGTQLAKKDWDIIKDVRSGDVIFCCKDSYIIYIAIATIDTIEALRPEEESFSKWAQEGYKVQVDIVELKTPLALVDFKQEFHARYNNLCSQLVFNKNLDLCQIYMAKIPPSAAVMLLNMTGEDSTQVYLKKEGIIPQSTGSYSRIGSDKETIIKARVGQGLFRKNVLALWRNTCPITGVDDTSLLIASHIVPWQQATSSEKVDKFNGLPLTPNLDKLFDKGLISFTDDGQMLISNFLQNNYLVKLGIISGSEEFKLPKISNLKKENIPYLKRHRELYSFE